MRTRANDEDEAKSESDLHEADQDFAGLDVFDGDSFMEGLKCEKLFGPVDSDDVNLRDASDTSDSESDADDEDVMADNVYSVEGVDDLDDVPVGEDAPDTGMFDMTDAELREIVKSGWIMYDEEHSGKSG